MERENGSPSAGTNACDSGPAQERLALRKR